MFFKGKYNKNAVQMVRIQTWIGNQTKEYTIFLCFWCMTVRNLWISSEITVGVCTFGITKVIFKRHLEICYYQSFHEKYASIFYRIHKTSHNLLIKNLELKFKRPDRMHHPVWIDSPLGFPPLTNQLLSSINK